MRIDGLRRTLLAIIVLLFWLGEDSYAQRKTRAKPPKVTQTDFRIEDESTVAEGMKFLMKDEPARALPIFEKLTQDKPEYAAGYYLTASAYIKLNQPEQALSFAKKAQEIDGDNEFYAEQLAELYTKARKYNDAALVYEILLKKKPDNFQYGVALATMYVFTEQFDKAIATYDYIERTTGISEEITRQKQQIYLRQNKLDKALKEGNNLIASEPGEVAYRIELAEMLIANDRLLEAIGPLEHALKINPDEAQAHVLLADIYRKHGNIEKCNQELKSVFANPNLDADPKIRVLSGYKQMLKSKEDYEQALGLASELLQTHPSEPKAIVIYADLLMQNGEKEKARNAYANAARIDPSVFEVWAAILQLDGELNQPDSLLVHSEEALEVFPNQGMFWYSNGTAYLMKKQFQKSVSALDESLKLIGDRKEMLPYIYGQLGDAYNGLGDNQKSDESYDLSLKANPENDHVLNNYSYFLSLRKEKLDLALSMSQKLVNEHKDNATYLDTHAWVLYIRKDYKKAKEYLERAVKNEATISGTILEHYGDVLFQLGERENAITQWKKAKIKGETTELLDKKIATGSLHEQ